MKKIVFLPLSPDMWEGFQTLWEEAKKDENNIVTVIPVPTYIRDSSGRTIDTEYILSGYPAEVEVTDINDYIFEKENPDTIYIQNAQNQSCIGFFVNPFFFTGNLKKFTKNLVYVPYDCYHESIIGGKEEIEDKRAFLVPNGVMDLDHIIVQSEAFKDFFLKMIAGLNSDLHEEWNKKISWEDHPRTKILSKYSRETVPHPAEWDTLLSTEKETHLLCTSIFNVLNGNRSYIKKLFSTIKHYQTTKESTLLIWRPHREIENVLKSLRPELVDEYNELLDYFKTNNIGILDDTKTPTAAIVLSDKYIGDYCGIMELFKSTGKTIEFIKEEL